jgi:hypothetical protein
MWWPELMVEADCVHVGLTHVDSRWISLDLVRGKQGAMIFIYFGKKVLWLMLGSSLLL